MRVVYYASFRSFPVFKQNSVASPCCYLLSYYFVIYFWGSSNNNPREEKLLEFLMNTILTLANRENHSTFVNRKREEVINLTFTLSDTSSLNKNWHINNTSLLSDHSFMYSILIESFRNIGNTNWDLFKVSLVAGIIY